MSSDLRADLTTVLDMGCVVAWVQVSLTNLQAVVQVVDVCVRVADQVIALSTCTGVHVDMVDVCVVVTVQNRSIM